MSVRWVPPPPPPLARSESPSLDQRGGNTRFRVRGVGDPFRTTGQKAWHPVYSVLDIFHNGEYTSMLYEVFYTETL